MSLHNPGSLDETIHGATRLKLLSILTSRNSLDYVQLRDLLAITDGAMSTATKKLEDAGYIKASKKLIFGKSNTTYSMTTKGRRAWENYLIELRALIPTLSDQDLSESIVK